MRAAARALLLVALLATTTAAPRAAFGAPPRAGRAGPVREVLAPDARQAFDRGAQLFASGNFEEARAEFVKAHQLSREPRVLYNVAVCEKSLRRYARAVRTLEASLEGGESTLPSDYVKLAQETIRALRGYVSELVLEVEPIGAVVAVDGVGVGEAPLTKPVTVDVGEHRVTAERAGYASGEVRVTTTSAQPTRARLVLRPGEAAAAAKRGRLRVLTGDAQSLITLDGKPAARGELDVEVAPAEHRVRVEGAGEPYETEVVVREGEVRTVSLTARGKGGGVPLWVWIGGGVAVAAGATVAIVALTSSSRKFVGREPGTTPTEFVPAGVRF